MANATKDIGEIWRRLFDHRPFLNGEIKLFLHEFEEKRGNREVDLLFQILQNLTEIRDTQIDKIKSASNAHLETLRQLVDNSSSICNRILEKEETYKADITLEKNRELRKAEREALNQNLKEKCQKIDEAFKKEEEDLHNYISNLKEKVISEHSEEF